MTLSDLFEQAVRLQANPETLDQAIRIFNEILNADPTQDLVAFHLATAFLQRGDNALSIRVMESIRDEGVRARPEYWNNIGVAHRNDHRLKEAEEYFRKALSIDERAEYWSNMAILYVNEGCPEKGLEYARRAVEMDPSNPKNAWNLSLILLELGELDEGFEYYDAGLVSGDRLHKDYGASPWNGEDLTGKRVIVHGEQGLGDEIMGLGLLDQLIRDGSHVTYDAHDRLFNTVKDSFPGIEVSPTRKGGTEWATGRYDYQIPLLSLFRRYRPERKPYLVPDPAKVAEVRKRLSGLPRPWVGIAWTGGAKRTNAHYRSFNLTKLRPILEKPFTFISLQYTPEAADKVARHKKNTGIEIHHFPEWVEAHDEAGDQYPGFDYGWTLALISVLDFCVLPNTTAVHACGAIGTKCYTLTPDACAWRYRNGGEGMWMYGDHVRVVRENGDWKRAIEKLAEEL